MGKRGEKIRPCHVCGEPVNFVFWKMRDGKRIFHWANPDGSHHEHSLKHDDWREHMRSILREQF